MISSPCLRSEHLSVYICFWILLHGIVSYSFIQSHVHQFGLVAIYTLGYSPIVLYFAVQIVLALALLVGSCVPLTYPHHHGFLIFPLLWVHFLTL